VEIQTIPTGIERVLSVSAHPDDSEFFAGGTLAQLADNGAEVTLAVCTDGCKGGRDLSDIIGVRSQEQDQAAATLGIGKIIRLGFSDGELNPCEDLRRRLIEIIRQVRPDIIFGHHPQTFYKRYGKTAQIGHSDHRASGTALMEAIYPRAGSPNFYPGLGGEPWSPAEIWLFDCENHDHVVDISDGINQKVDALTAHESQHGAGGGLPEAAKRVARLHGSDSQPAEVFVRLSLRR
jgi:LmbE family N-acetylglucosaminyl deacetylase